MRKLFLIPLLTLFCSVMAWGETVQVATTTELTNALSNADADVIELTKSLSHTSSTFFSVTRPVTIDLGGNTITSSTTGANRIFFINATGVTIKNGTLKRTANRYYRGNQPSYTIWVAGGNVNLQDLNIETTASLSRGVYIGGGETTISDCTISGYLYGLCPTSNGTTNIEDGTVITGGTSGIYHAGGTVNVNGGTITGTNDAGIVTVDKAILNVNGGNISGKVHGIAGNGSAGKGDTKITITGGTIGSSTTSLGIYHPQAGTLNISGGTINGKTGVGIKSGTLTMDGGTIHAYGEGGGRVETWGNGIIESKAALQIESNASYAGNMNITVSDDATLISDSYYAIYEYGSANTAVSSFVVEGGKFQGGILTSQSLAAKGGFVSGGKWSVDVLANCVTGKAIKSISENPYLFEVVEASGETAEIKNAAQNAVLTNTASETEVAGYRSDNVGDDAVVKTTTENNAVVVSENTDVVATENHDIVEVKKVTVEGNAALTVTEGATLMVGAGSVLLDTTATTGGLTVEAGATLVVDGLIYGSTEDNFVIESQEGKSGIVLFSPETEFIREDHPKATYRFTSKAFWSQTESKWVYQRFGVPTFDGHATLQWLNNPGGGVNSWVKKWDYENDDWTSWTAFTADQLEINDAIPFQGLMLASDNVKPDNTNPAMVYEFTGSLMGNSDANLHFYYGWNYYANSYTAPININEFIQTVKTSLGGSNDILATIYLYQDLGNDTYTWQAVNEFTAGSSTVVGFAPGVGPIYENVPSVINPMQAFLMRLNVEGEANQTIDYADNVYTPATTNTFNPAPARNRVTNNSMQISVFNANGNFDKVFFVENDNFSNDLDNGFDAYKYDGNKGVSLYAMSADKHMEILASNDVDGSFIGINAPEAGNYTLYFSGIQGMNYALIDMTNNTVVTIEEGGQFNFYAEAGQNDYRFQLVAPARVPTAVENVGAKADVKGVYTITGQYLGEDINALPKGVYIINGAKVVK